MITKRVLTATVCVLGLFALMGTAQASAAGSMKVLEFTNNFLRYTTIGPGGQIGSTFVITGRINNAGSAQFGKPAGALVGRILVDCTVLSQSPDGICNGIAHLPDGFFTFVGNGPFSTSTHRYYAITGGVGPYANDRGQLKIFVGRHATSISEVVLISG